MPRINTRERNNKEGNGPRRMGTKRKACRFCSDKDLIIDYKMVKLLCEFITDRCKLVARRTTGNCQYHQRRVVEAISRARHLALIPYTIVHAVRD